jgi:hypothetical protein
MSRCYSIVVGKVIINLGAVVLLFGSWGCADPALMHRYDPAVGDDTDAESGKTSSPDGDSDSGQPQDWPPGSGDGSSSGGDVDTDGDDDPADGGSTSGGDGDATSGSGGEDEDEDGGSTGTPAPPPPPGDPMWAHCSQDAQCDSGLCLIVLIDGQAADGYCTDLCSNAQDDCDPAGGGTADRFCLPADDGTGVCGLDCDGATCPAGMECRAYGSPMAGFACM